MRKSQLNGKAQPFLTTGGEAVTNNNGFGCSSAPLRNLRNLWIVDPLQLRQRFHNQFGISQVRQPRVGLASKNLIFAVEPTCTNGQRPRAEVSRAGDIVRGVAD